MIPTSAQKIASLLVVYLTALLQSPTLTDAERKNAKARLQKLAAELQ